MRFGGHYCGNLLKANNGSWFLGVWASVVWTEYLHFKNEGWRPDAGLGRCQLQFLKFRSGTVKCAAVSCVENRMSRKAKWWSGSWLKWDCGGHWGHCNLQFSLWKSTPHSGVAEGALCPGHEACLVYLALELPPRADLGCAGGSLLLLPPKLPVWDTVRAVKKQNWSIWTHPAWIHILLLEMQQWNSERGGWVLNNSSFRA